MGARALKLAKMFSARRRAWAWSLLVLIALSGMTAWIARSHGVAQRQALRVQTEAGIAHWGATLQSSVPELIAPLHELLHRWRPDSASSTEDFERAAKRLRAENKSVHGIGWVGPEGVAEWPKVGNPEQLGAPGNPYTQNRFWADGWERARKDGRDAIAQPRISENGPEIRCILPIFDGDGGSDNFKGAIVARFALDAFAARSLGELDHGYRAEIRDEDITLFHTGWAGGTAATQPVGDHPALVALAEPTEFTSEKLINVLGRTWELRLTPMDAIVAQTINGSARWILIGGFAVSLLISGLVYQEIRGRAVHDAQSQQHRRALEKLNEIATQISARLDSPRDVLDPLASAARELLDMGRSVISLLDAPRGTLKMVAYASNEPEQAAEAGEFALHELPLSRKVLEERQVLFIEDAARDPASEHAEILQSQGIASVVLIPLHVGERELGVMALSSARPRQFSSEERRLARLLGSTAAVILSNSELYARMGEAMRHQQRLFEQREALFAVNAAVYQASSFQESLQMIAELAPGALDVDLCMVTLTGDDDDKARVAAVTHPYGTDLVGKVFQRRGTNGEIVRVTRRMLVIEDGQSHPGVHPAFRAQLNTGSIAYMPLLRSSGEFMGTLVLVRHMAGPFAAEQLNLAEIFTARAAAAVENAQLLDQTRRDAEAKTMLLRELNHRVKNNMASIITLLSLDEPELSRSARLWLDRAIARIRTMASAHDLFSGGMDRVALVELVEQTIPSLSVLKPPGVTVRAELNGIHVMLRTDRAVSLAMVLHELCSNAILHGLGDSGTGTVTIRAQLKKVEKAGEKNQNLVIVEVLDEGRQAAVKGSRELTLAGVLHGSSFEGADIAPVDSVEERYARAGNGGGLGLILVQGLVARELGGTFSLSRDAGGGSVARVEFPARVEETRAVV